MDVAADMSDAVAVVLAVSWGVRVAWKPVEQLAAAVAGIITVKPFVVEQYPKALGCEVEIWPDSAAVEAVVVFFVALSFGVGPIVLAEEGNQNFGYDMHCTG